MAGSRNNITRRNRRRIVEIYFILYLAALIFILPNRHDTPGAGGSATNVVPPPFSLMAEKFALFCRARIDSTGLQIVSIDSVNNIFYSGDVEDVRFEFMVEDQTLKQSIRLTADRAGATKFFRVEEQPSQNLAVFYWLPPLVEPVNKTYIVNVTASARAKHPTDGGSSDRRFEVRTRFSLNVVIINGQTLPDNILAAMPQINQSITEQPYLLPQANPYMAQLNKFSLIPEQSNITAVAYQEWTNTIHANNINLATDLADAPEVRFTNEPADNGGEAYFVKRNQDRMTIQGKAPSVGRTKIEVKARRRFDLEEFSTTFYVSSLAVETPDYPRVMYPEKVYTIDPKLPLMGKNIRAVLRDKQRELAVSSQGGRFQFSPDVADTGKIIRLERYIDGILYGQVFNLYIVGYPDPEILDISPQAGNRVDVVTRSYGRHNREKNEIRYFIIEGNAKYLDLRGNLRDEQDVRIQRFSFTPIDPSRPFEFKIIAVDSRGKKSTERSYR